MWDLKRKKNELIEIENKLVVGGENKGDQSVQISNYKMSNFGGCNVQCGSIFNNTVLYI